MKLKTFLETFKVNTELLVFLTSGAKTTEIFALDGTSKKILWKAAGYELANYYEREIDTIGIFKVSKEHFGVTIKALKDGE